MTVFVHLYLIYWEHNGKPFHNILTHLILSTFLEGRPYAHFIQKCTKSLLTYDICPQITPPTPHLKIKLKPKEVCSAWAYS